MIARLLAIRLLTPEAFECFFSAAEGWRSLAQKRQETRRTDRIELQQYALTGLLEGWFTSSALAGCIPGAAIAGEFGTRDN